MKTSTLRILRLAVIGSLLALACSATPTPACCEQDKRSLEEQLHAYRNVFLGQVIRIVAKEPSDVPEEDGSLVFDDYEVTLRVTRAWSPGVPRTVVVHTHAMLSTTYPFQIGRVYLVFANRRPDGGVLDVDGCSPTRAEQDAILPARELDALVAGYAPK